MKKSLLMNLILIPFVYSSQAQAQHNLSQQQAFRAPIRASAVITKPVNNTPHLAGAGRVAQPAKSDVVLMNVPLTAGQKRKLQTFKSQQLSFNNALRSSSEEELPKRVELGMNNVPVLDQGMHGTCVTFATTAAFDALIGKGDYVSQLCGLELGNYLETRSYLPSGWDGSFGPLVLDRFREFGIVSQDSQRTKTCAGVTEYPLKDMSDMGSPMSLEDYAKISEDMNYDFYWYALVTPYERFTWETTEQADKLLNTVKRELAAKDAKTNMRLTFGALLPVEHCSAGACGKYHKTDDTWAITKSIREDQELQFGGHEMVITGYDDNAVAVDNEGGKHQGLLILRNSWSDKHGDNGDYYMTYEFFKQFVMEVQKIGKYE